jgi:hypothetical protein
MKLFIKIVMIGLVAIMFSACTNKSDAERALKAEGFSDIEVTGYDFFACSEDDFYHTGFRAKNSKGQVVTGTVCSGLLFKNATIRY